ncbi:MAG TPA: Nudix family hydrolase [Burkholderiales bacterium]|nr:Nudix family hydrolase [Burkholderiales bacterium]
MRRVAVAAAVIINERGEFLLAQRPAGKPYLGYWEFPGGKIESGETAPQALARELEEELGIRATAVYPWITRDHDYTHASVRLHFHRVAAWQGELHGRENQAFAWQSVDNVTVAPLLPANAPILRALALPPVYGISSAGVFEPEGGHQAATAAFLARFKHALHDHGLRLLQVREKNFPSPELRAFLTETVALARPYGARVLLNSGSVAGTAQAAALALETGADGLHLTAADLMAAAARPAAAWCGASCHGPDELARAAVLGLDFAVLGPVQRTSTHPDAPPLGWERFAEWVADYPLPVYAIGGMRREDLPAAWRSGAHGVALLRGL